MKISLRAAGRGCAVVVVATALASAGAASAFGEPREMPTPTTWTLTPPPPTRAALAAVSCASPTRCVAVGAQTNGLAAATLWNGTRWVTTPPSVVASSAFTDVSCVSATRCTAVGTVSDGVRKLALVERFNGRSWSPAPRPTRLSTVVSISCVSASMCMVIGATPTGVQLSAVWIGNRWSYPRLEQLPPRRSGTLLDVSCASLTYCAAVGSWVRTGVVPQTLIEVWDGTRWSTPPTPVNRNHSRSLVSVSCGSPKSCMAVGRDPDKGETLIDVWDGMSWGAGHGLNFPSPFFTTELSGVSCVSATSCVAVGSVRKYGGGAGDTRTFVQSWGGARLWRTRSPGAGAESSLAGVSCTSERCVAIGSSVTSGGTVPFAITGAVSPRTVTTAWTAEENARLLQVAAYLHLTPAATQKAAVYGMAYLIALATRPFAQPNPLTIPFPPTPPVVTYTTVWKQSEFPVIDAVRVSEFYLRSSIATKVSFYALSYLLALGGH